MLSPPTTEEGEALLFEDFHEELEYLRRKDACLENQHKIKRLRTQLLGRNTHQHCESLDALAQLLVPKLSTHMEKFMKRATLLTPKYGCMI